MYMILILQNANICLRLEKGKVQFNNIMPSQIIDDFRKETEKTHNASQDVAQMRCLNVVSQ